MRSKRQLSDPITRGSLVARPSGPTRVDCLLYVTHRPCPINYTQKTQSLNCMTSGVTYLRSLHWSRRVSLHDLEGKRPALRVDRVHTACDFF